MDTSIAAQARVSTSPRLQGFHKLMPMRIREVLLVASEYDSFTLEEEGQLTDLILQEYDRLNLRYAPRLTSTPSAEEALDLLGSDRRFDLVIVTMHPGEMDPADFARAVRKRYPRLPVILLGYDNRELQELLDSDDASAFDRVFVWTGDARILLAVVSTIEDQRNVDHDTRAVGVEVIILIEDSVHFISAFLPILYGNLLKQSQRLIGEGINIAHTVLRMRARPKILLAGSFEEAWDLYGRYREYILGIISDVRFRRGGRIDPTAGLRFARHVRDDNPNVPILLQSTDARNAQLAKVLDVGFLHKNSPQIRQEIDEFMLTAFGFGPFVFRSPDGAEVGVMAHTLRELRDRLLTIPEQSLLFHARHNHFSAWLKARTEFRLAASLESWAPSECADAAEVRRRLITSLDEYRRETYRDAIAKFKPANFGTLSTFGRIGGGSLGGKGRGLAFLNTLLHEHGVGGTFPDIDVLVPPTVVISTEVFDEFMEHNALTDVALSDTSDDEIRAAFLRGELPASVTEDLRSLVGIMHYPFAVRSSSLLEDSQHQSFAGVYETYMLPNVRGGAGWRLQQLCTAIKLVYASTFSTRAKAYLQATPQRPEKEKMAVIIQKLIGSQYRGRFYPSLAGVAQSYNYYPFGRVKPSDGAASIALGLGTTIVEGGQGLRFCPRYPRHVPQLSSVDDILANTQRFFHALPLDDRSGDPHQMYRPHRFPVEQAQGDPTLRFLGSIYSHENHAVYDGIAREGTPVITFAGILKHDMFPLPELLEELLERGTKAMSTPVELEFAADLNPSNSTPRTFACLQMRPLPVHRDLSRINMGRIDPQHVLCRSPRAMGHGRIRGIQDVICIVPHLFDRKNSVETAAAVTALDAHLRQQGRPYLLIGPGRWGSADPWLGIPVNWGQITGARIIVETGLHGTSVTPSDGSHFFHNIIAFQVGYLTTNTDRGEGMVDWDWLLGQETVSAGDNGLRWMRLPEPAVGLIDGETRTGVILKSMEGVPAG